MLVLTCQVEDKGWVCAYHDGVSFLIDVLRYTAPESCCRSSSMLEWRQAAQAQGTQRCTHPRTHPMHNVLMPTWRWSDLEPAAALGREGLTLSREVGNLRLSQPLRYSQQVQISTQELGDIFQSSRAVQ
jgi:hypothetical protein